MISPTLNTTQSQTNSKPTTHHIVHLRFTLFQLGAVDGGFAFDFVGHRYQPALIFPAAIFIAAMPFVTGEVLIVGIPFGDAECTLCGMGIPAYKVDGVGKIIAIIAVITAMVIEELGFIAPFPAHGRAGQSTI